VRDAGGVACLGASLDFSLRHERVGVQLDRSSGEAPIARLVAPIMPAASLCARSIPII